MSTSAAQAAAFYDEVVRTGMVWGARDAGGFAAPLSRDGSRAMPFWSLRTRVERVVATVPAYGAFEPVGLSLAEFRSRWLPGLERDAVRVGVNWSGPAATGYDLLARDVELNLAAAAAAAAAAATERGASG
jgi:hypothetical protein